MKSACRFGHSKETMDLHTSLHTSLILPRPNIFIKVIRGLQALEIFDFQRAGILKVLQYTENPIHLKIGPETKVWSWY